VLVGPEKGLFWDSLIERSLFLSEVGFLSFFRGFQERLPLLLQEETFFLVHVSEMELSLYRFLVHVFHASRSQGQDTGVLKVDAVIQLYAELCHSCFVRMIQPGVLVVFPDPGPNERPGLSSANLTTFAGDVANARCFQDETRSSFTGRRKLATFLGEGLQF